MVCDFEKIEKLRDMIEYVYDTSYVEDGKENIYLNIYLQIELPFASVFYENEPFYVYVGYDKEKESYFITDLGDSLCYLTLEQRKEISDDLINDIFNSINDVERYGDMAISYFDFNDFCLSELEAAISRMVLYISYSFVRYFSSVC